MQPHRTCSHGPVARTLAHRLLPLAVLLVLPLASCGEPPEPPQAQLPAVTVARPDVEDVPVYVEFTGVTAAAERVELRARVSGFLQEVAYEPGQVVQEGDILFRIDPAQYEAEAASFRARLQSAEADLGLARVTLERMRSAGQGAVAEIQVEEAQAQVAVAESSVAMAQADLQDALLRLSWTEVRAPITGRVSRNLRDVGNLVGSGESTLLATMVAEGRMYAYFDVAERRFLEAQRAARQEGGVLIDERDRAVLPVEMALSDGAGYRFQGQIDYRDPEVDPSTGTLRIRGAFDNPDGEILSGLFVRVRVEVRTLQGALLVNERAVSRDQAGTFVLVVGKDDLVEVRPVELGDRQGDRRVVLGGLAPEDRVVVEGLLRARPGAKVRPEAPKPAVSGR